MERNKNTHCKWCSAYGCSNSKNKRPELSFLRFPSDPDRCKKWVVNTRRADLLSTPVEALSGLQAPSASLQNLCHNAETIFRSALEPSTHISGLRSHIIRRIMEATSDNIPATSCEKCNVRRLVLTLFVNIRLHHHLKLQNGVLLSQSSNKAAERKTAIFRHQ
ncbi:52 kda repressor of the inhibitor of the protein kinase [Plakobranchus ocellatus]|uniref:52 kDa repressor of the inhibitor of the protein kinase n=1 Tax=Plakobranchus ocellatus TaxID=259542 RepID=A0AAV4CD91_9GAST|nr:52 kda repressor of the inhibitor of the protein kinase [Plakobranchus ocellatus]